MTAWRCFENNPHVAGHVGVYHGCNRPCRVKVCVYLWMIEAVRPGNDIYSDT